MCVCECVCVCMNVAAIAEALNISFGRRVRVLIQRGVFWAQLRVVLTPILHRENKQRM